MRETMVVCVVALLGGPLSSGCLEVGIALAGAAASAAVEDEIAEPGYSEYDTESPYFDHDDLLVPIDTTSEAVGAAGIGDVYFAVFWENDDLALADDRYVAGYGYVLDGLVYGYAQAPVLDEGAGPGPSVANIVFLSDEEPCPQYEVLPQPSAERTLAEAPQQLVYVPPTTLDPGPFPEGVSCALPGEGGGSGILAGLVPVDCEEAFGTP